jgi:hypothetical protein
VAGIITIDSSDLLRVANNIERSAKEVHRLLEWRLSMAARERVNLLKEEAPSQTRTDPRHPIKVRDSFSYIKGSGTRTIVTSTPYKVSIISTGTRPHYIHPLFRKALWWPGLAHPVRWVGPPYTKIHPGTAPNDFIERAFRRYDTMGGDVRHAQVIADMTVIGIATRGPSMQVPMDFGG